MLEYRTAKIVEVDLFDELVQKTYGKPYNFQQQDGCKPRGITYFTVPMKHPYDYKESKVKEEINGPDMGVSFEIWKNQPTGTGIYDDEMFWERNFYPSLDMVVQDLYKRGLIEPGDYAIDIDW